MLSEAREVQDKLALFNTMRTRIRHDVNLSEAGKRRALENLEASIQVYRQDAAKALTSSWREAKRRYDDLQERAAKAEAATEARYDFAKLAYHRQVAEAEIKRAATFEDAQKVVERNAGSGDAERRRAWLEAWPVVAERHGSAAAGFTKWMRGELERELTPATAPKLEADKLALLPEIKELHAITNGVDNFYTVNSGGFSTSEFRQMLSGVSVQERFKDGQYLVTIDFVEPEASASVKPPKAVAVSG